MLNNAFVCLNLGKRKSWVEVFNIGSSWNYHKKILVVTSRIVALTELDA
jgi:hypothetical protein